MFSEYVCWKLVKLLNLSIHVHLFYFAMGYQQMYMYPPSQMICGRLVVCLITIGPLKLFMIRIY